jgi:two-component system osmolarity sensor histidine kinase EnvZ
VFRLRTRLFIPRQIKRWLPTSLFGRSLLIIVLPVAVMQIAVTWAFFDAHWETVTSRLSEGLAGDVAWAVQTYKDDPSPRALDKMAERAEESMSLSIALQKGRKLPTAQRPSLFASLDRSLRTALDDRLDDPFWFDTTRYPGHVDIRVQVKEGVLRIIAPRDRAFATQGHIFILWMVVATLLLTGWPSCSSATRCGPSSGWPTPPTPSGAASTRPPSSRTARARSARRPRPSWP